MCRWLTAVHILGIEVSYNIEEVWGNDDLIGHRSTYYWSNGGFQYRDDNRGKNEYMDDPTYVFWEL